MMNYSLSVDDAVLVCCCKIRKKERRDSRKEKSVIGYGNAE